MSNAVRVPPPRKLEIIVTHDCQVVSKSVCDKINLCIIKIINAIVLRDERITYEMA